MNLSMTEQEDLERVGGRVVELESILKKYEDKKILIPSRGAPDPDWISSALAHRLIARRHGIETVISHIKDIRDRENRAVTKLVGGGLIQYNPDNPDNSIIDFSQFAGYSLVDSRFPDSAFQTRLEGIPCISIVDHHSGTVDLTAEFIDIDEKAGSTATRYVEFLQHLNLLDTNNDEHRNIATALMHGIRSDTDDLLAVKSTRVYDAVHHLSRFIDFGDLRKVSLEVRTEQELDALFRARKHGDARQSYFVASVGTLTDGDIIYKVAEFVLEFPQVSTAIIGGIVGDYVICSLRTIDDSITPGDVLRKAYPIVEETKNYGGRDDKGGCEIPMSYFGAVEGMSQSAREFVVDDFLKTGFYNSVGIKEGNSEQ
jgi:nanoRNase/pAp phosphatase (c-di-AMP/oligoRNAs hydrolase)